MSRRQARLSAINPHAVQNRKLRRHVRAMIEMAEKGRLPGWVFIVYEPGTAASDPDHVTVVRGGRCDARPLAVAATFQSAQLLSSGVAQSFR